MPGVTLSFFPGLILLVAADPAPAPPFDVVSAKAAPKLTQRFAQTEGWTGGDVAQSIPLTPARSGCSATASSVLSSPGGVSARG
jgi:hypothetical protein